MGDPTTDFVAMMTLEPHGPDTFVGAGPRYPWGGLYGGQIVAQALRAAAATVEPHFRVHSLHAYFIRRGDHAEPVRYEVDRVRNGRSFVTRTVTARQAVGAILSMSASFQVDEEAIDAQIAEVPADVPPPEHFDGDSWSTMFDRATVPVPADLPGRSRGWLRIVGDLGDDPVLHACAFAYMSDDYPTDAAVSLRPDRPGPDDPDPHPFAAFSLDHAIWFHRPARADDWHLTAMVCHGLIHSRGLTVGHIFSPDGIHVASVAQEVLIRRRRDA